ncbi:MAG: hypothetical protein ACF8R7_13240 [Phycisphaerales bacterium JB039]
MAIVVLIVGLGLIALGAGAYLGSGQESATALIPAIFGVVIALCGGLGLRRAWQRPTVAIATVVALAGVAGSLSRLAPKLAAGEQLQLDLATGAQLAMAAATTLLVVLGASWLLSGAGRPIESEQQQRRGRVAGFITRIVLIVGALLILLGAAGYFGSGQQSATALIPAIFGALIFICGLLALRAAWRGIAAVAGLIVSLAGAGGALYRIAPGLFGAEQFDLTLATGSQLGMSWLAGVSAIASAAWFATLQKKRPAPQGG